MGASIAHVGVIVHRVNTFEPWTLTGEDYLPLIGAIVDVRID
jgi:hypothetical protein